MAEQWEHMTVNAIETRGDAWQIWTVGHPTYRMTDTSPEAHEEGLDAPLRLVNMLGDEGWQVISADRKPHGPALNQTKHTYWLKRRKD